MTGVWITMDWDRLCHLWVGSFPPAWDEEAGRFDRSDGDDLECVGIRPMMACRLTRRDWFFPGDIMEMTILKCELKNYK